MKVEEPTPEILAEMNAKLFEAVKDSLTTPELLYWCSERTLNRYIRARKYKLDDAIAMLKASIAWRKEHKPDHIRFEDVYEENKTGKMYVTFDMVDKVGRPVVIMRPRNQNTANHEMQIKYFVYVMERASYLTDKAGLDKMCWVLDCPGYSMKTAPPMKTSMETLRIMQDHYPERLGEAICYKPPTLWTMFWRMIKPFVDPVTVAKVCMATDAEADRLMTERFDMDALEAPLGGRNPRSYDQDVWAKAMVDLENQTWEEIKQVAAKAGLPVELPQGRGVAAGKEGTVEGAMNGLKIGAVSA